MSTNCEFILIVTLARREKKAKEFGDNSQTGRFFDFKRRLKLKEPVFFPGGLDEPNTAATSNGMSEAICQMRKISANEYMVVCCMYAGYCGGMMVDVKSMKAGKRLIHATSPIYNFIVYKSVVVYADCANNIFIAGLETPVNDQIGLTEYRLNDALRGSKGLSCGRNMVLDGHMTYLFCNVAAISQSKIVRFSLKDIDPVAPKINQASLKIQDVITTNINSGFYLTKKFIYVFDGTKFFRLNKSNLEATEMSQSLENSTLIQQIVGTDKYVYAMRQDKMLLLQIGATGLTLLDEAKNEATTSLHTRSLISACSRSSVAFVIRLEEEPCGVSLYSSFGKKLFCLGAHTLVLSQHNRILGGMYDAEKDRIIFCMESFKSQLVKLTY